MRTVLIGQLLAALALLGSAGIAPVRAAVSVLVVTKTADTNDGMCTPDDCSLRDALDVAPAGSTIMIPKGTYTLNSPLAINVPVTLQGAGADDTIIQAATSPGVAGYRVFDINATGTVALNDLTVRHGAIIAGAASGGAIFWSGSGSLEITRSKIVFNVLDTDGSNGGAASGGAMFLGGIALLITDSTIADNAATANGDTGVGGAVSGGAIFADQVFILRSTIARNRAVATGPVANGAVSGGAIFASSVILTDSTVSGNAAVGSAVTGGALFVGRSQVSSSTVVDNVSDNGKGTGTPISGMVTARNSIFAANIPANCGNLISDGYVLVEDATDCSITPGPGDLIGTAGAPINPLLAPLAHYGGPTDTHALETGSPAIDAGNPGGCTDENGMPLLVDQRGFPRTVDGNGDGIAVCDMGAFEFVAARPAPVLDRWALVLLCAGLGALGVRRFRTRRAD